MVLATDAFAPLAREAADSAGIPGARICVVPHPIGGVPRAQLLARAEAAVDEILWLWSGASR